MHELILTCGRRQLTLKACATEWLPHVFERICTPKSHLCKQVEDLLAVASPLLVPLEHELSQVRAGIALRSGRCAGMHDVFV